MDDPDFLVLPEVDDVGQRPLFLGTPVADLVRVVVVFVQELDPIDADFCGGDPDGPDLEEAFVWSGQAIVNGTRSGRLSLPWLQQVSFLLLAGYVTATATELVQLPRAHDETCISSLAASFTLEWRQVEF